MTVSSQLGVDHYIALTVAVLIWFVFVWQVANLIFGNTSRRQRRDRERRDKRRPGYVSTRPTRRRDRWE